MVKEANSGGVREPKEGCNEGESYLQIESEPGSLEMMQIGALMDENSSSFYFEINFVKLHKSTQVASTS